MKITKDNICQTNYYTWRNEDGETITIHASSRAESSNKLVMRDEYNLRGNCKLILFNGGPIAGRSFWCFTTHSGPARGFWHHEYNTRGEALQARKLLLELGWVTQATKVWKEVAK